MSTVTFQTLFNKEIRRFIKVSTQTITAPVLTSLLYMLIFGHALNDYVQVYPGVTYTAFLVPGLVMMTLLQNAFANSSSSLIQSKMNGSIVFMLLSPASHTQIFFAYMLASVVRGVIVGAGIFIITAFSIHSLPTFWQHVSEFNPFFYLVDGFRYGFFGHSDVNPWTSLIIVSIFFCFFAVFTLHLLRKGYKLRF